MNSAATMITDVPAGTYLSDIATLDDNELQSEIRSLASHAAALMCRTLLLVAELDRRGAWLEWGINSCVHWLSWQCGYSPGAAREHVRVARVLVDLPRTIELFSKGELSYAKVRAITRVGTPENEALLVEYAKEATAAQLERIVGGYRRSNELEDENNSHANRRVEWNIDGNGGHVLTIHMTAEDRGVIKKAHEKALADVPAGTSGQGASVDAFVLMAQTLLATGTKEPRDRYLVNLNVDVEVLANDSDGECNVEGQNVPAESARRLSCDAPVVTSLVDGNGVVLKMGRKSRLFTGASRAAVMKRDNGTCIFPGCENRRWVDVHHITHWTKGGLTDPENGAVLCGIHHRLVHEGGFSLDHDFVFRRPDGQVVPKTPQCAKPRDLRYKARPNACISTGNGERFDLNMAVGNLMDATGGDI